MTLIETIYEQLELDIIPKTEEDKVALRTKVESAYREVLLRRNYPEDMTEATIAKDMGRFFSSIYNIALYDFNQRGAEGHNVLQENGEYRSWQDREKLFRGVVAFARIL